MIGTESEGTCHNLQNEFVLKTLCEAKVTQYVLMEQKFAICGSVVICQKKWLQGAPG